MPLLRSCKRYGTVEVDLRVQVPPPHFGEPAQPVARARTQLHKAVSFGQMLGGDGGSGGATLAAATKRSTRQNLRSPYARSSRRSGEGKAMTHAAPAPHDALLAVDAGPSTSLAAAMDDMLLNGPISARTRARRAYHAGVPHARIPLGDPSRPPRGGGGECQQQRSNHPPRLTGKLAPMTRTNSLARASTELAPLGRLESKVAASRTMPSRAVRLAPLNADAPPASQSMASTTGVALREARDFKKKRPLS